VTGRVDDVIIQTASRLLVPHIQLYALYVLAHGHGSPGGGFQGGCILAASFILMVIAYDLQEVKRRIKETVIILLCSVGVFLFAWTGWMCLFVGGNFLDYGQLSAIIPTNQVMARYYGIAVIETGVQITVMAVMVLIFLELATGGVHREITEDTDAGTAGRQL